MIERVDQEIRYADGVTSHPSGVNALPRDGGQRRRAVGAILQLRPRIDVMVGMAGVDFDRVWTLAVSGQLYCYRLACTEPR